MRLKLYLNFDGLMASELLHVHHLTHLPRNAYVVNHLNVMGIELN